MKFKYNVDQEVCAVSLFTSKKTTILPGLFEPIENIKIEDPAIEYANKVLYYNREEFSKFYTIRNNYSEFPIWAKQYDRKILTTKSIDAFRYAYKKSLTTDSIFANVIFGNLYYKQYSIYHTYIWSLKSLPYHQLMIYLDLHANTGIKPIYDFDKKMHEGFEAVEIKNYASCLV